MSIEHIVTEAIFDKIVDIIAARISPTTANMIKLYVLGLKQEHLRDNAKHALNTLETSIEAISRREPERGKLTREAYEKMLRENVLWLRSTAPDTLERRHIEMAMQHSLMVEYDVTPELRNAMLLRAQRDEAVEALKEHQWERTLYHSEEKCRFCGHLTEWEREREAHDGRCPNFPGIRDPDNALLKIGESA